jgi:hypothetical protein
MPTKPTHPLDEVLITHIGEKPARKITAKLRGALVNPDGRSADALDHKRHLETKYQDAGDKPAIA